MGKSEFRGFLHPNKPSVRVFRYGSMLSIKQAFDP